MIWIGPKHSDIFNDRGYFCESITICGSGAGTNAAFTKIAEKRINYNSPSFNPGDFFERELNARIEADNNVQFMFYNQLHAYFYSDNILNHCPCINSKEILEFLDAKSDARQWAARYVPIVPFVEVDGEYVYEYLRQNVGDYIVQDPHSSGGYGTILFENGKAAPEFTAHKMVKYLVSDYYKNSVPININIVIFGDEILLLPPSVQIIQKKDGRLLYIGADYPAFKQLDSFSNERVYEYSKKVARKIQSLGYRGIMGIDFLVKSEDVELLEINARFQASTFLLNDFLAQENLPSIYELNLCAFNRESAPEASLYHKTISNSCIAYLNETNLNIQAALNENRMIPEIVQILWDGYTSECAHEPSSYLFRCIYKNNISCITSEMRVDVHPNIISHSTDTQNKIMDLTNPITLKVALLNQGVVFSEQALKTYDNPREGVHNSIDIFLENLFVVNCPVNIKFSSLSPFVICCDSQNRLYLSYYNRFVAFVRFDAPDYGKSLRTLSGLQYSVCSFLATDRLRIHHTPKCWYKLNGAGCGFCNADTDNIPFSLSDISEMLEYYCTRPEIQHFLIGGGSSPEAIEIERIANIAKILRRLTDKNIYVMCLPPKDATVLNTLFQSGVTEIAFNIEIQNRELAMQIMPQKGRIPLEQYMQALEYATGLWGKTGNVRTLFIVGLEPRESLLTGVESVCKLGVQPILSAFRPLPKTVLEHMMPPENQWLLNTYYRAKEICDKYGQELGPSCRFCQNNTISML